MYQKDYILRMIEMLGDLIAGIFGLIKKGDYKQASEQLGNIYYDMLKEDAFNAEAELGLAQRSMGKCWCKNTKRLVKSHLMYKLQVININ